MISRRGFTHRRFSGPLIGLFGLIWLGPAPIAAKQGEPVGDEQPGAGLSLDAATRSRIGLKTETLTLAERTPQLRVVGWVLDPGDLVALVQKRIAARAALAASRKDYQRIRGLFEEQHNVSNRALEQAEAALKRDEAAAEAIRLRLAVDWGELADGRTDLHTLVRSLADGRAAIAALLVPLAQLPAHPPARARVVGLTADRDAIEARYLSTLPKVDRATQRRSLLYLVSGPALAPGTAVAAWLDLAAAPSRGVVVPAAAVVRHAGAAFVYVEAGGDRFRRQPVSLDWPVDGGWFVRHGLPAGARIAIVGAQQLLSIEMLALGGGE